ncbi:MAG: hypothetical protein IPK52_22725 [Chloroflexi bacterium]|nr:hypothetical protein [Chloroflexota bacterium]
MIDDEGVAPMSDSNEQEYMQNGLEALNMGDFNAAQVFFKQAIRVNNSNEEAWLSLARTYPTEPDKALKCYENVLKINPLNSEAQGMIDRLSAAAAAAPTPAPAAPSSSSYSTPTPDSSDTLRDPSSAAPKERKPLGGPAVSAPKGIEGAPETVNLDYFVDFFQRAFKGSMALLTGQGDGSSDLPTSWWNATLMVVSVGFITGLFAAISGLRFGSIISIFTMPLLVTLTLVVAVGGGAFLSHWYLRTYRDGSASLLDHTMAFVRVWFPASLIFAVVLLISGLTGNFVMGLRSFLLSFGFSANGLGLILLIVNIAVTAYSALLLQRGWARLYPTAIARGLWIAVAIALVTTGIIL